MSDRAAKVGLGVLLLALAAAALAQCAHAPSVDTPQFRACRAVCNGEGFPIASITEDEDTISCECRKPASPPGAPT